MIVCVMLHVIVCEMSCLMLCSGCWYGGMIDFMLFGDIGDIGDGRTDERTNEQTFVLLESLLRLKTIHFSYYCSKPQ